MKILVVGPQHPDSFARNIAASLESMGHQVISEPGTRVTYDQSLVGHVFWSYLPRVFSGLETRVFGGVVKRARSEKPDLILVGFALLPPQIVEQLKDCCPTVVCWYTDPISNLGRLYLLASPFDAVFVKEPFLARALRDKLGVKAEYLPECCNPLWHHRLPPLNSEELALYSCDLAAMGTLHYYRAKMFEQFTGYDVKIWGGNCPVWLRSPSRAIYKSKYVAELEKAKALSAAKIVINTVNICEIEGVNCCLFETAGCGAFQIAEWKSSLPDLFEPETEIVTFRNRSELKDKVDYYLRHPEERQKIADRAYRRAHAEHTYRHRLEHILTSVGGNCKTSSATPDYTCV